LERESIQKIDGILKSCQKILITSHTNPDGDAIGSALGLYLLLKKMVKAKINVLIPNGFPDFLDWLPASGDITIFNTGKKKGELLIEEADVLFSLDYNSYKRVEAFEQLMLRSKAIKIMIDHHPEPESYFDFAFSNTFVSSTAEMVYSFIDDIDGTSLIDRDIAANLYTGIVTDTGSFSYLCNSPKTYHIVASLISTGIDGEKIHQLIYDTNSVNRIRLLGFTLSERLKVIEEYRTAYIFLSHDDMKRFNYREGDTEGFVNYPLSIKGIRFTAFFRELENKVRISFRSKGDFSVNEFARNHFNGGGHKNASGADAYLPLNEVLHNFEQLLPQYAEGLLRNSL